MRSTAPTTDAGERDAEQAAAYLAIVEDIEEQWGAATAPIAELIRGPLAELRAAAPSIAEPLQQLHPLMKHLAPPPMSWAYHTRLLAIQASEIRGVLRLGRNSDHPEALRTLAAARLERLDLFLQLLKDYPPSRDQARAILADYRARLGEQKGGCSPQ